MIAFRFRLEKALEWRRTQLELAEAEFRQAAAELAEVDRARAELGTAASAAGQELRARSALDGFDLEALEAFRLHVRRRDQELASRRTEFARRLAEREASMLEARRRCRLLEKLRERRLAEWTASRDRELDEVAAESYLARWHQAHPYNEVHEP